MELFRNTLMEIDLDQLRANIRALKEYVGPDVKIAPVIKANAYGHGAVVIAGELERLNVTSLAVAAVSEAIELRQHGINSPILVMGYTENRFLPLAVNHDVTVTVFEYEQAKVLSDAAARAGKNALIHIKVDTGFHRLGKRPTEDFAREIEEIHHLPSLRIDGVFSHLRLIDMESDRRQFSEFKAFVEDLRKRGVDTGLSHISDSIAAIRYKDFALDMIRPGAIIYGLVPDSQQRLIDVKQIMKFKTRVTRVMRLKRGEGAGYGEEYVAQEGDVIATLAAGFGDGYFRSLGGKGQVTIRGKKAKIVGRVCMDQMMANVTNIPGVTPGDEAVLYGPGENETQIREAAALVGTNKNEIASRISRRVPRVYIKDNRVVKIVDYLTEE